MAGSHPVVSGCGVAGQGGQQVVLEVDRSQEESSWCRESGSRSLQANGEDLGGCEYCLSPSPCGKGILGQKARGASDRPWFDRTTAVLGNFQAKLYLKNSPL